MSLPEPPEARLHSRVQLPVSAEISCVAMARFRQPAHLRDVSAGGAFLYAQLQPAMGALVRVDFTVPVIGNEVHISCEGRVVRVELESLGQTGMAVEFNRLNLGSW